MALQADGKIVVVGSATVSSALRFAVARYNTDGLLDTSFDSDGKLTTAISTSSSANSIAIERDGRLVVVGASSQGTNQNDFTVVRYNAGSLEERQYALSDANHNVTALVNTSGTVLERYQYDPYGNITCLNAEDDQGHAGERVWLDLPIPGQAPGPEYGGV